MVISNNNVGLAHVYQKRDPSSLGKREQEVLQATVFPSLSIAYHSRVEKAWAPASDLEGKPSFRLIFGGSLDKLLLHD